MNSHPIDQGTATIIAALIGIEGVIVAALIYRMRDKRLAGIVGVGTLLLVGVAAFALLQNLSPTPQTAPTPPSATSPPTVLIATQLPPTDTQLSTPANTQSSAPP